MERSVSNVIIDTDCGIDDALSLELLLQSTSSVRVVAVTVVHGNVGLTQAVKAARVVVGNRAPIFAGCGAPLLSRTLVPQWDGHGSDGLGGCMQELIDEIEQQKKTLPPELAADAPHAVQTIIDLTRKERDVTILAIGPLTNLAVAVTLDPTLRDRCRVISMAACLYGKGNVKNLIASEFNVACDPEAAKIVIDAWKDRITLVPWETTLQAPFPWSWLDEISPQSLLSRVSQLYSKLCRGKTDFVMCDIVAACILLDASVGTKVLQLKADVECSAGPSRGAVLFDWYGETTGGTFVVDVVDAAKMVEMCRKVFFN